MSTAALPLEYLEWKWYINFFFQWNCGNCLLWSSSKTSIQQHINVEKSVRADDSCNLCASSTYNFISKLIFVFDFILAFFFKLWLYIRYFVCICGNLWVFFIHRMQFGVLFFSLSFPNTCLHVLRESVCVMLTMLMTNTERVFAEQKTNLTLVCSV